MKQKISEIVLDVSKALCFGIGAGFILSLILFAGGFLFGGFFVSSGLEAAKDGLLLIAAILIFIAAGMILTWGKKEEHRQKEKEKNKKNGWNRHFRRIGFMPVLLSFSGGLLICASIADWLLMNI